MTVIYDDLNKKKFKKIISEIQNDTKSNKCLIVCWGNKEKIARKFINKLFFRGKN